jgi:hypothetical protein
MVVRSDNGVVSRRRESTIFFAPESRLNADLAVRDSLVFTLQKPAINELNW